MSQEEIRVVLWWWLVVVLVVVRIGFQIGKANWLVVSLTCDLARSSKCRHTCFASRSGQLSRGYNWRIWPIPRNRTEYNTRINTLVWGRICFVFVRYLYLILLIKISFTFFYFSLKLRNY